MSDFAYDELPEAHNVIDATIEEGKDCETLIPVAILRLQLEDGRPPAIYKLPLDVAETLCRMLLTCSAKAREHCWE